MAPITRVQETEEVLLMGFMTNAFYVTTLLGMGLQGCQLLLSSSLNKLESSENSHFKVESMWKAEHNFLKHS